jgi:hypothetical protein
MILCAFHTGSIAKLLKDIVPIELFSPWHVEPKEAPNYWVPDPKEYDKLCVCGCRVSVTILLANERYFCDKSMNVYRLGTPDPRWIKWLKTQRWQFNYRLPLGKIL